MKTAAKAMPKTRNSTKHIARAGEMLVVDRRAGRRRGGRRVEGVLRWPTSHVSGRHTQALAEAREAEQREPLAVGAQARAGERVDDQPPHREARVEERGVLEGVDASSAGRRSRTRSGSPRPRWRAPTAGSPAHGEVSRASTRPERRPGATAISARRERPSGSTGERRPSTSSAGAMSERSTCCIMCADSRYLSPIASSGESSATASVSSARGRRAASGRRRGPCVERAAARRYMRR